MTAIEALDKIRVMLGLNEVEAETTSVETETATTIELAEATLLDGTVVKTEGEFEVGKQLFVVTEEGDVPAPTGRHETTDGQILVVDDAGIITEIEQVVVEEEEKETEENFSDDLISQLVGAIQPSLDKIEELSNEVKALKGEFHEFKDEPAGMKVSNNLNDYKKAEDNILESRMEKIIELRRANKSK